MKVSMVRVMIDVHLASEPGMRTVSKRNAGLTELSLDDMSCFLCALCGGLAVGRWTCDLQVAGSIPSQWLSRNIGQLLASLRGR